jgi:protocatechuate 3,4-dioxygenase beta subunit
MKKQDLLFASVLFFFFLFTLNNYSQVLTTETVTGHVYAASGSGDDHSNIPVANATITLHSFMKVDGIIMGDSVLYQATTDSTGLFLLTSVVPGKYILMATAAGFETLALREFNVEGDKHNDTEMVNLFLHDSLQIKGGLVSGNVKFNNSGQGVFRAIIEFINVNHAHTNIFTTTNMDGKFSAKVPAGQYYVSCTVITSEKMFFFQEFYQNATLIDSAKIVTVTDGQNVMDINFNIPDHVSLKHNVTFNGNVQSTTNTPVSGATVKVWAAEEHDWDDQHLVATAKTDTMGNYSISMDSILQSKNTFVVSAHKDGFKLQFYNGKNTFYQADRLLAVNDTTFTAVNFNLSPLDTIQKLSISGSIMDSAGIGVNGAFAVIIDSLTGHVRVAVSDSAGKYSVSGLASGSYFMLIYASGFVPQFYKNADRWEDATVIKLTSGSLTAINVTLQAIPRLTSSGQIVGTIHSNAGTALPGTLVTIKSSSGATVASAITDGNGVYTVTGLTQGSYSITASIAQYSSQQQSATYDPSFGSTTVSNFSMSTASVTAVKDPAGNVPAKFELHNNYPNPFNPSTIISFTLPVNSLVRLQVYNILGQKVAELINKQMNAGNYNVTFNADKLSSGVYLYRLEAGQFTATKKMILTK